MKIMTEMKSSILTKVPNKRFFHILESNGIQFSGMLRERFTLEVSSIVTNSIGWIAFIGDNLSLITISDSRKKEI